jgi:hypothetical protein
MAEAQMSSTDAPMGENSGDLERFRYAWIDLHVVANFIWIGSVALTEKAFLISFFLSGVFS